MNKVAFLQGFSRFFKEAGPIARVFRAYAGGAKNLGSQYGAVPSHAAYNKILSEGLGFIKDLREQRPTAMIIKDRMKNMGKGFGLLQIGENSVKPYYKPKSFWDYDALFSKVNGLPEDTRKVLLLNHEHVMDAGLRRAGGKNISLAGLLKHQPSGLKY